MLRLFIVVLSYLAPPADLQECVNYWQGKLQLQDWKITLQVVSDHELDYATLGDIEPDLKTRSAVMRIQRETDSDLRGRLARAEQRVTIIHEMAHLRRYASGDPTWRHEGAIHTETAQLIRKHRRWFEMLALEP